MKERFTVTLQPVAGWRTPAIVRLRKLLKAALRAYGLRCVEVKESKPNELT